MSYSPLSELFAALEAERSSVQQAFFDHYYRRIVGLVRSRIDAQLRRRVDASDIANSAFRSFFLHAQAGDFHCQNRPQLWKLLATITMNKLRNRIRFHKAEKRSMQREAEADEPHAVQLEPTSEDIVVLQDEIEAALSTMKPYHREIAERILAGQSNAVIAAQSQRSSRTIRRIAFDLEQQLIERFNLSRTSPPMDGKGDEK